jgi:hypothetical protein
LTATPVFQDKGMRVVEQVLVQDSNQGTVRKSDLERVFKLAPSGQLEASAPSLWTQVAGDSHTPPNSAAPPPAPAPSEPKPTPPKTKPNH